MLLMPDELEEQKRLEAEKAQAEQAQAEQAQQAPAAPPAMTAPAAPLTPWERMQEDHGTGGSILRILGTGLSGGILGDVLMPEMTKAGQDQYASELKAYEGQAEAYTMAQALAGIDPEKLTPGHIALADAYGGSALSEYYTDQYRAQQAEQGTDHAVAELAGVPYAQWIQRSPEQKRADRNYYQSQSGDGTYFDAQLQAQGKAPEQVRESKESELYGSAKGQQYGDDRQTIMGVRGQVMKADQTIASIDNVMGLLQDPNNEDLTGIERQIRDVFWANRREDGTVDAVTAAGIVDLISQATFGALSQSELDLLKGGLMDPNKSVEYNIGTLTQARKRVTDSRDLAINSGRSAAERYSNWEGQDDYAGLMSEDWNYLNIGEGSRIKPITKMVDGEEKTVTFSDYYRARMEAAGPYEELSREQIVIDYRKAREAEKEAWERRQQEEAERAEAAQRALELEFME